jgi:hypothetical protein
MFGKSFCRQQKLNSETLFKNILEGNIKAKGKLGYMTFQ